jgi:ribose transport system permease protein
MQDFDLSFASMISLSMGVAVVLMASHGVSWPVAALVALGLGLAAGLVNGFLVSYLGASSFIITLATGTFLTGIEFAITDQNTIAAGIPTDFSAITQGTTLGLNNQIYFGAAIALIVWILLDWTEPGRYMRAIGGNPEAARLSGVRVRAFRLWGFVIVALLAALVGLILASYAASYSPNSGASYLLPAYAAVFLGAAVFKPGEFNIPGTVVGVLFLGVIQTGLTMLSLETFIIYLVQSSILVIAVLLSRIGQRI